MKEAGSRAADRQAIDGGHVKLVRGEHWGRNTEQPPLPDTQATYPKKKQHKAPKKERCAANPDGHTHEWMKDEEQLPVFETQWRDKIGVRWIPETQSWEKYPYRDLKEVQVGTKPRAYKMCVHCGKILVKGRKTRYRWGGTHQWREPEPGERLYKYTAWNGRKVIR